MTEQIIVRQENKGDFSEVFELHCTAFERGNEARLVAALRNNPSVFVPELSIVATNNGKIVGHILFTKINIKDINEKMHASLSLAPMAVSPHLQKKGIGKQLIKKGLQFAKDLGFKSVIVLGHEHYYPKFGFLPAGKWNIHAPVNVPPNVFMAIELENDELKNISGTVIYPEEFETV